MSVASVIVNVLAVLSMLSTVGCIADATDAFKLGSAVVDIDSIVTSHAVTICLAQDSADHALLHSVPALENTCAFG